MTSRTSVEYLIHRENVERFIHRENVERFDSSIKSIKNSWCRQIKRQNTIFLNGIECNTFHFFINFGKYGRKQQTKNENKLKRHHWNKISKIQSMPSHQINRKIGVCSKFWTWTRVEFVWLELNMFSHCLYTMFIYI